MTPPPPSRNRLRQRVALALFGLSALFFVIGLLFLYSGFVRPDEPVPTILTPASLGSPARGSSVALEGRIAPDSGASFRDFVVFDRAEYIGYARSSDGKRRPDFRRVAHVTPRLVIVDDAGATVEVVGNDYRFAGELARFEDGALRLASDSRPASVRVTGFLRGDRVVVLGLVAAPRVIQARTLFRGGRAAYLSSLANAVTTSRVLGGVFAAVGALLATTAMLVLRKR